MNIGEFLSLKEGDRIVNPMSNTSGAVTKLLYDRTRQQYGVTVQWDRTAADQARSFTKDTTAWMHWEREGEIDAPLPFG